MKIVDVAALQQRRMLFSSWFMRRSQRIGCTYLWEIVAAENKRTKRSDRLATWDGWQSVAEAAQGVHHRRRFDAERGQVLASWPGPPEYHSVALELCCDNVPVLGLTSHAERSR